MKPLSKILTSSKLYIYNKEDYIYFEGEMRKGVYRVLKGRVKLCKQDVSTHRIMLLYFVYPNDFFGMLDFFTDLKTRAVTAIAMDNEVQVEFISNTAFEKYMAQNTEYFFTIFQSFIKKEENIWDRYFYQRYGNSYEKVYHCLQILAKEKGVKTDKGVILNAISQKELANYLGLYRQRINDSFIKLKQEGKIDYNNQYILLLK